MNEPNKREPYICPKCGGENCDCTDYEWDSESLHQQYVCQDCGEVWDEYHELIYRGYACKDVDYDEKGEVIP